MKNIYKSLFFISVFVFGGCEDPDKGPIFLYEDLELGAYARLVSNEEGENLVPIVSESGFDDFSHTYQVEFVDGSRGSLVSAYKVDVEYLPLGKAENKMEKKDFISYASEQFVDGDSGFKQIPETAITSQALIDAFGLSFADLSPKDQFRFKGGVVHENGAVYNSENSSSTVNGTFFQGYFDFTLFVGCETSLDKSEHVVKGGYIFETTVTICKGEIVSKTITDTVRVTRNSTVPIGEYSFDDWSFGVNKDCFGEKTPPQTGFVFTDVCGVVEFSSSSSTDDFGNKWNYTSSVNQNQWTIVWDNGSDQDDIAKIAGSTVITFPGDVPFTVN